MIRIEKNFEQPPAALLRPEVADCISRLLAGDRNAIQSNFYRGKTQLPDGSVKFEVVEALMLLYHDKCGYCETKEHDPQAEHYRPKGRVTGARIHPGYFWLVYEWSNLLPTCFDCNKIGTGKGNRFPLRGGEVLRIFSPPLLPGNILDFASIHPNIPPLLNEQPFLLHPEVDQPEVCFRFTNKGIMKGIDAYGRGQETIKICNLNRRNLKFRRQKILDIYVVRMTDALLVFRDGKIPKEGLLALLKLIFSRLKDWGNPTEEYSLFGNYAFANFTEIFLPLLPAAYRTTVEEAFGRFRVGEL